MSTGHIMKNDDALGRQRAAPARPTFSREFLRRFIVTFREQPLDYGPRRHMTAAFLDDSISFILGCHTYAYLFMISRLYGHTSMASFPITAASR